MALTWHTTADLKVEEPAVEPDKLAQLKADLAAAHALNDEYETTVAQLRFELRKTREELELANGRYESINADYRKKARELHDLQDPTKREGREAQLLTQLGAMQSELFDTQAQLRSANGSIEQMSAIPETARRQLKARGEALAKLQSETEKTWRIHDDAIKSGALLPAPADSPQPLLTASVATERERDYYERLIEEVNGTRARSVKDLKAKFIGMLSDMMDGLTGEDDE